MATINDLPNELLLHIFSYLRCHRKIASCVCRRWDALFVPELTLRLCRTDDGGGENRETTFRSLFRRSWRQYERLSFGFRGCTDLGDSLWTLERFPKAREVYIAFKENNLERFLMYLDALGRNVERLTISLTGSLDFGPDIDTVEENRSSGKVAAVSDLRHVLFINLSKSTLKPIYNWFQRNAPNIESLHFVNGLPAEFIQLYAAQLKKLNMNYICSKGEDISHIKCPKLQWFCLHSDKAIISDKLDGFIEKAPQLRFFELRSDSSCQHVARALTKLPNLETLKLQPNKEVITFEEHDKFPALRALTLNCPITDVPQLPVLRKLMILQPTSDRFYSRMVFRAPNLTYLYVEKDTFLNDESIVSICTGLTQLTDLRLKIRRSVRISRKAFSSIHLLHQLQRFYISFDDVSEHKWLGPWFKQLNAPAVAIVSENSFVDIPRKNFNLLLANRRLRILTLHHIFVHELHCDGGSRANALREVAKVRPDLQLHWPDTWVVSRW